MKYQGTHDFLTGFLISQFSILGFQNPTVQHFIASSLLKYHFPTLLFLHALSYLPPSLPFSLFSIHHPSPLFTYSICPSSSNPSNCPPQPRAFTSSSNPPLCFCQFFIHVPISLFSLILLWYLDIFIIQSPKLLPPGNKTWSNHKILKALF